MEQQLEQRFEELAVHCADSRDSRCLAELREAWESFHRTKDRNAGYMLNGEYEKARQGLTQQGRQLFKARWIMPFNGWKTSLSPSDQKKSAK
ncbi:hypothetical protein [Cohnella faecalis]|uniref:hypothetical protein n=1 Tax=Cohnella faecalis TaxID=2315694 RepID=UPI0011C236A1|nr:hypothetical protein [Cohnella faecalis]